ncbi:hypothetical protein ACHAWT_005673 [Skeletonema menzelii]
MTSFLQDSSSITNASITNTPLESQARSILASAIHSIPSATSSYSYPRAYNSSNVDGVVDSTTLLIAARTLSKLGRSDLSWDFLRTLFLGQSSNGFLPRLVYLNHTNTDNKQKFEGAAWSDFIGSYPGPKLFGSKPPEEHAINPSLDAETKVWSSNTIMATPHHATSILEIFYLSNQTSDDVDNLSIFYSKLQNWHTYLHQQTISNCSDARHANDTFPCLIVRHPLETEIDMKSPLWESALMNVTQIVRDKKWNSGMSIPKEVKDSFDYPGDDIYNSYIYLLQCLNEGNNNVTSQNHTNYTKQFCPFGMIDVGVSAVLAKADMDMLMIGQILADKNHLTRPTMDEMASTKARTNRSMDMLHALWDEDRGSFFNRLVTLTQTDDGWYNSNATMPLETSIAYNFFSMIDPMLNSSLVAKMSMQLLQRSGKLSFNCGSYPLWSVGGCTNNSSPIIPLVNYRVSTGFIRNGELGLGAYVSYGLLNLICGLPNSDESNLTNCRENLDFADAFDGASSLPIGNNIMQSSRTAAVVLDLLLPTKEFAYESEPPISASSVIFLIAAELVVAFAVGVVCLVLSLNLMRRANADEEGDEFVQLVNEHQHLYEESEDDEDAANASGIGAWSLELISSMSPMKWFSRNSASANNS